MSSQYDRKCNLVVSVGTKGLDLSNLRIRFEVLSMDGSPGVARPPTATIRVYNLSAATAKQIQKEFQFVMLQAGYVGGNYGIVFQGTIKQVRRGRENAKDSFVDIMASDGDYWRSYGMLNKTLGAGATNDQVNDVIVKNAQEAPDPTSQLQQGSTQIPLSAGTGGTRPRGRVLFGLASYHAGYAARNQNATWFVQNGKLFLVSRTGYLPGDTIVLNARSGLVYVPEATENGIQFTSLLNPGIVLGRRVQIANKDINSLTVREQGFPGLADLSFPATVTDDGFYRVLAVDHKGDSRGQEWYTSAICLAIDSSAPAASSVNAS